MVLVKVLGEDIFLNQQKVETVCDCDATAHS